MANNRFVAMQPGTIPWAQEDEDGTRSAVIDGQRGVGTYTYAFFMPAGFWDEAHSHAADVRLVVLSGALLLTTDGAHGRQAATGYPAGTWLFVPRGHVHADGADQPTIIVGTATGPWSTDYA